MHLLRDWQRPMDGDLVSLVPNRDNVPPHIGQRDSQAVLGHVLQDQRDHSTVVTAHIGRQASVQLTLNLIILA